MDEEERKKRLEEARNIVANNYRNEDYSSKIEEANSIINSVNPHRILDTQNSEEEIINNNNNYTDLFKNSNTNNTIATTYQSENEALKPKEEEKEKTDNKIQAISTVKPTDGNFRNQSDSAFGNFNNAKLSTKEEVEAPKTTVKINNSVKASIGEEPRVIDKKEWDFFQSGAFEDGYQPGDILKTAIGTVADIGVNLVSGVISLPESIIDVGANIVATGQDIFGFDENAKKTRNFADYSISNTFTDVMNDIFKIDDVSVLGETTDNIFNTVGYVGAMWYGGALLSGIGKTASIGTANLGASANLGNISLKMAGHTLNLPTLAYFGGASSKLAEANAKGNSVTELERWGSATFGGTIEMITEGIFGMLGIGGSDITDDLISAATKGVNSAAAKTAIRLGISAAGESAEEFMSYAGNYIADNFIIDKLGSTDFSSEWSWSDVKEQMILAFASTLIANGGGTIIQTNDAIKAAEQQIGRNLTNDEKALVTQSVISQAMVQNEVEFFNDGNDVDTGNIGMFYIATYDRNGNLSGVQPTIGMQIDNANQSLDIQPVIIRNKRNGGYNTVDANTGILIDSSYYNSVSEAENGFNSKIVNLDNASVTSINNKVTQANVAIQNKTNEMLTQIQNQRNTSENVNSNTQTPSQNVQNATQTGTNNVNVNQGHINTSNVNQNINTDANINANIDQNNPYQTSQNEFRGNANGNTSNYTSNGLSEVSRLMSQISDNSVYGRDRVKAILRTVNKNIPTIELQTNGNTTYLNSLDSDGSVSLQQQISNRPYTGGQLKEIVNNAVNRADLSGINTAQTSENGFIGVSNANTTNYASQNGNKNVGQNNEQLQQDIENFSDQVDAVLDGTFPKRSMLTLLSHTPKPLLDIGLQDFPITMTQRHLDTIMNESGNDKNANYHGLGVDTVKQLPEAISNPLDIVKSNTKDDSIVLTTYLADNQDRTVIASIRINGKGRINNIRIDTNVMTSAYGRNNYDKFMQDNIKNGNLLYDIDRGVIKKVDVARFQLPGSTNSRDTGARLQLPRSSNSTTKTNGSISNNSIAPNSKNVNEPISATTNNQSMQNNENNTSRSEKVMQEELHNRIQNALLSKNSRKNTFLGTVSDKVVNKVKSLLGIDVSGRRHMLSDNDIRHMIKEHGNPAIEKTKGQIAITTKDIEKIPDIINNYDNIIKGNDNKQGQTIRYIKNYTDNKTYVVEVIPDANDKTLYIKTMWKKPITLTNSQKTPSSTSKTRGNSSFSTSSTSIPQTAQNVKDNGIRAERTSNTTEYDNQGNKLTKAQRDFFKDSKVRDENGNLLVMYHGTNNEFTIFDKNKSGQSNSNARIGFWFTETKEGAKNFAESLWYGNKKSPEIFEVYLNIKKPKIYKGIDNSKELYALEDKMADLKQRIRKIENRNINIEINSSAIRYASDEAELIDIAEQNGIINRQDEFVSTAKEYKKLLNDYDNVERDYNNKRYNDSYELFRTDIYKVAGKDANDANFGGTGMWLENESEIIQKYKDNLIRQGYDGIIIQETNYDSETMGRNNNQYVVFDSNQIKNITNSSPTSNPDIRYEKTDNITSKPYDARAEQKQGFVEHITKDNYLKQLMEVDNSQGETYAHSFERRIEQEIQNVQSLGAFDNSIPITKLSDIDKLVEDFLGTKVMKGHFRQRARGIYNTQTDTIRVKELKDMDNVLHEMGHALDLGGRIKIDKGTIANELLDAVSRHGGYENDSRSIQLDEGFAEIVKEYAINSSQAKLDYPQTYAVLEAERQQNAKFNNFMGKLQNQIYNYIHQNPQNRLLSNMSIGEQTDKKPTTARAIENKIVRTVWDRDFEVKRLANEMEKSAGRKLSPSENVYLLTRLASGTSNKIISMLSKGYIDENGNRMMPGLSRIGEILGNDPQRMNDLRAYLVAKRDLEYKAKSLKTGIRTMDSKAVVERFYNDTQIQEAAQVVYDTLDGVLQYAVNNGLITQDTAKSLRESNVFYVPFQRVIVGRGNQTGRRGAVSDVINKRTGSELDIKDVFENIVANSSNIIQQVENNNILRTLAEEGKEAGVSNSIFEEIAPPMKKIGTEKFSTWESELKKQGVDTSKLDLEKTIDLFVPNNDIVIEKDGSRIVNYFDYNGNRKYLQFYKGTEDIFNSLMGLDKNGNSLVLKIMRNLNMPLRYGATMANVGFAIPNMISDTIQATIYSEAGFIPVVDNVLGVLDILGATNKTARKFLNAVAPQYAERVNRIYDIYQQTGASSATRMNQYRESTQKLMKDIYGTKSSEVLGIKESFKPLKRLMDLLTYIPELSESSTRFRVFERNYNASLNKGMTETDARIQAAIESRDATQDFGRTGTLTGEVNKLIPFSAARVGSAYTFAEKIKANPKRTSARIAVLVVASLAIKALGYDDEEIEELNQRKKDDNFVIKIGNTVFTIKKPQGILRSIINLAEYTQDLATGHIEEGKELERLTSWLNNAIMDNMPADEISGLVPSAIAPLIENSLNKDFYYNTDIVKSWDLDLPNSEQYYDYNSQLAIWLGKIFNYSPAKIDNLFSGWLGGLGTDITGAIDWVSAKMGLSAEKPTMGAEDNAVGKRFVVNVNENSASIDEIYDREEELTKKLNGGTITEEENVELENIKAGISKLSALNKQIKAIKQDLTMSGTEKADAIRPLQQQKTDVARQALGKEPIYTENTDELDALEFYPSRSTLSYNGLTLELTEEMKQEYMNITYELYQKYAKQGIYSEQYLEVLKSKVKDAAKKKMIQKYRSQLVK